MNEHLRYALAAALLNHWRVSQEGVAFGRVKSFAPIKEEISNVLDLPTSSCRAFIQSLINSTKRRHIKNIRYLFENDEFFTNNSVATSAAALRNDVIIRISMSTQWMEEYSNIAQAISNEEDAILEVFSLFGRPIATYDIHKAFKYIKTGAVVDVSIITNEVRQLISQVKRIVSLIDFVKCHPEYTTHMNDINNGNIKFSFTDPDFVNDIFTCKAIAFEETSKAYNEKLVREKLEAMRNRIAPSATIPRLSVADVHRTENTF